MFLSKPDTIGDCQALWTCELHPILVIAIIRSNIPLLLLQHCTVQHHWKAKRKSGVVRFSLLLSERFGNNKICLQRPRSVIVEPEEAALQSANWIWEHTSGLCEPGCHPEEAGTSTQRATDAAGSQPNASERAFKPWTNRQEAEASSVVAEQVRITQWRAGLSKGSLMPCILHCLANQPIEGPPQCFP